MGVFGFSKKDETELHANLSRKVRAGKSGWLIVDYNGPISAGDIIGKA